MHFRCYPVARSQLAVQLLNGPCILSAFYITGQAGGGTFTWSLFDGTNTAGNLMATGDSVGGQLLSRFLDLNVTVRNGLFFTQAPGAGSTATWMFVIGSTP